MDRRRRSSLAGGILLILLGVAFLAFQVLPGVRHWFSWPWIIIGVGVLMLLVSLLTAVPALAIPACIVSGIGGLFYWQSVTGNWESWSYAWALIPGFVGVGILLSNLLSGKVRQAVRDGGGLILTSLILFVVFASLLGGVNLLGPYWPVILILLGLWGLVRPLFRSR